MKEETLEKFPQVKELSASEQESLFKVIDGFQYASQQTIIGGEELLRMCDGCAFKKGTEANRQPMTVLTAVECVLKGEPFYCHKRFCADGSEKLCNGWINIMN